jgi:hypothetical protein
MKCIALALGLAALAMAPAQAAPVTYNFIGTLTSNDGPPDSFPYAIGERVPLSFTLQTDFPDGDPSPTRGQYYNPTGVPGIGRLRRSSFSMSSMTIWTATATSTTGSDSVCSSRGAAGSRALRSARPI